MIKVTPLTDLQTENFTALFKCYYAELGCADDAEQLVQEYVLPDLLAGLLHVDLLYDGGGCIGFVIYQKDDIDNDWNYKEGWATCAKFTLRRLRAAAATVSFCCTPRK